MKYLLAYKYTLPAGGLIFHWELSFPNSHLWKQAKKQKSGEQDMDCQTYHHGQAFLERWHCGLLEDIMVTIFINILTGQKSEKPECYCTHCNNHGGSLTSMPAGNFSVSLNQWRKVLQNVLSKAKVFSFMNGNYHNYRGTKQNGHKVRELKNKPGTILLTSCGKFSPHRGRFLSVLKFLFDFCVREGKDLAQV